MQSNIIAMLVASEATRRGVTEPPREPRVVRPRKHRRAAALALHSLARRLDPYAPTYSPRW